MRKFKLSRRSFIKVASATGAALVARLSNLVPETQLLWNAQIPYPSNRSGVAFAALENVGEVYAGFILLPEGSPIPPIVKAPKRGVPSGCGAGRNDSVIHVISEPMQKPEELAGQAKIPVYALGRVPSELRPSGGYILKLPSGEIVAGSIEYESFSPVSKSWVCTVSIWVQIDFPKPFPLWSQAPVEPGGPAVVLEKTLSLPVPGIRVATQSGYVFHWIEDEILYILSIENGNSAQEAQLLVNALAKIL